MSYNGSKERNKRLKRLHDQTKNAYTSGAYFDEDKGRLVRYYRGKRSKFLKQLSSKKCRRIKLVALQHSQYKRIFDYWWELF